MKDEIVVGAGELHCGKLVGKGGQRKEDNGGEGKEMREGKRVILGGKKDG